MKTIDTIDTDGLTKKEKQFLEAVITNDKDTVIKLLRSRTIDFNFVDKSGSGLLHWAARLGHTELLKLFFKKRRFYIYGKNNYNDSILSEAKRNGYNETVAVIREEIVRSRRLFNSCLLR